MKFPGYKTTPDESGSARFNGRCFVARRFHLRALSRSGASPPGLPRLAEQLQIFFLSSRVHQINSLSTDTLVTLNQRHVEAIRLFAKEDLDE